MDHGICRDLRAGLHVDDAMFSLAAKLRDTRLYFEKWNRDHPDQQISVDY
jgi:hypothetical protein